MPKSLTQKIKELPLKPGVYIFKDSAGDILYVGKANKLRNRVRSYFRENNSPQPPLILRGGETASGKTGELSPRIRLMTSQIANLDFITTNNETEALILENNFIKRLQPKYNVALKDDKNFQFIKINIQDEVPTISYERQATDSKAKYLGPYTSSYSIKHSLRLLRKIFPYCSNSRVSSKPCFYYHIRKCPGVCIGKVSLTEYRENINKIIQFLSGRQLETLEDLKKQMKQLSLQKQFEKAAKIRDQIYALNNVLEKQKLVYPKKVDQDVFSVHTEGATAVNLFIIREGKLIRKENFILKNTKGATVAEILEEFLPKYYLEASDWPKEILLPVSISTSPTPSYSRRGIIPKILVPVRGLKLKLLKLGTQNAKQYLENSSDKTLLEEARLMSALKELQRVLNLPTLPGRIEAYDISNIQGTNPVGSMVVFDYGRPKKQDYRKFKIRINPPSGGPDDYAMMAEMLERRFAKPLPLKRRRLRGGPNNKTSPNPSLKGGGSWPLPDLILIDGGKGQLNSAIAAISKSQFSISNNKTKISNTLPRRQASKNPIPIIGLAKRLEEIFVPGRSRPITLPNNSIALFLLQRIRDEAHRFAVTFHRKLRSASLLTSSLDSIPGIGTQKKKQLLSKFETVTALKSANLTELSNVVGKNLAQKIKAKL